LVRLRGIKRLPSLAEAIPTMQSFARPRLIP
jgi:hypothetical protein